MGLLVRIDEDDVRATTRCNKKQRLCDKDVKVDGLESRRGAATT